MDQQRMQNAAEGFTQDQKGNRHKFERPAPGVHLYRDVWPDSMETMNKLLDKDFWKDIDGKDGAKKWVREDFFDDLEYTRENGKQSDTCWLWQHEDANNAFRDIIDSYCFHWNIDPKSRESLRISRFSNGEFFGAHSDDSYATPRTVSLVYYPNDDYEGGELEFIHFGVTIKPKAGDLLVFPSSYSYEHKIHEIKGGNPRWTIVSFLFYGEDDESALRRSKLKTFPYKPEFKSLF
jgi:hypothetical protein